MGLEMNLKLVLKTELGQWGETEACRYLRRCGYEIVDRNFRCRMGELDIVARKGELLCFVEVKTRRSLRCGLPGEAINGRKKSHILRAVQFYLVSHCIIDMDFRVDAIELLQWEDRFYIRHTENILS